MSSVIRLQHSTRDPKVDEIICGLIGLTETVFPEQVRAYYLTGSYADGSAIAGSDLDLSVVFKGDELPASRERLRYLYDCCWRISSISLDVVAYSESDLRARGAVWLDEGHLLFGEDIRGAIPRLPLAAHVRQAMHTPLRLFARARQPAEALSFPLNHPDPDGAWFGYNGRRTRTVEGRDAPGTHELLTCTFHPASALMLYRAGILAQGKRACVERYRASIGDRWSDLLETLYQKCRGEWHYFIPGSPADRLLLRELCHEALAFHNHFLAVYRTYLLAELDADDASGQLLAAQQLGKVLYLDREVVDALAQLRPNGDPALDAAKRTALQRLKMAGS